MRVRGVISALLLLQASCLWGQGVFRLKADAPPQDKEIIPRRGEVHIPVILLEFADVPLTLETPLEHFQDMLNLPGYSENGATGSVRDYFLENSDNQFQPVFDVFGPVKLEKKMAFYGTSCSVALLNSAACRPSSGLPTSAVAT